MCFLFRFQVTSAAALHTSFVFGLFFCGGTTVLFGLLDYIPLPDNQDGSIDVTYLVLAIVLRISQGIGTACYFTAAMTLLSVNFTVDKTTVLVSPWTLVNQYFGHNLILRVIKRVPSLRNKINGSVRLDYDNLCIVVWFVVAFIFTHTSCFKNKQTPRDSCSATC